MCYISYICSISQALLNACTHGILATITNADRKAKSLTAPTLMYGEIEFASFGMIIEKIKKRYGGLAEGGGHFVDLGSGTGKACFAAALIHDFDQVTGIEILEGLNRYSKTLVKRYDEQFRMRAPSDSTSFEFICSDLNELETWSSASVIFVNSTCFDAKLMFEVNVIARASPVGTFLITFTKQLPKNDKWKVLENAKYEMSWGEATVFIHVKEEE